MSPLRFSIIGCPIWQSLASLPAPLRNKRASGSVVEALRVIGAFLAMEVALGTARPRRRRG